MSPIHLYINRDVLVPLPDGTTIEALAASVRAAQWRATIKAGCYILAFLSPYHALDAVHALRARQIDAQPLVQRMMEKRAVGIPTDQFFTRQWSRCPSR